MEIRDLEKTGYFGYLFFIKYDGTKFDSFDENKDKISVKGEFKKLLLENNTAYYKGIQQAGRTDSKVNARENILYINSKNNIDFSNIIEELNIEKENGLEILDIKKTIPFLEFPDMIEKRFYIYEYPEKYIKNTAEDIKKLCIELSRKKDFSQFTNKKGKQLKNFIRNIRIEYKDGKLYFEGDAFLPQQVRIMSNFILNGKKSPLDGKYLTLERVEISERLQNMIFEEVEDLKIEKVKKIEKNSYFYVFYVEKKNKSEIIGKKGKNIKQLKKIYGDIVVKEESQ